MRKRRRIHLWSPLWLVAILCLAGCAAVAGEATIEPGESLATTTEAAARSEQPTEATTSSVAISRPTAIWSVKDADGDEVQATLSFGALIPADDPSVPTQVNPDCIFGQLPGRYLALTVTLSVNLQSAVAVTFVPNLKYSIDVLDNKASDGVSPGGGGYWIDESGGCADNGADIVSGWNLTPSNPSGELHGWLIVPGISANDPTGAKSIVHHFFFKPGFILGTDSEPTVIAQSSSTLVSCSASKKLPYLLPLDLVGARLAGCR